MKDDRYRVFARWKHSLKAHAVAINKFYIQNLLAEYYVRYDGYRGIAYYYISDTYIALFSRFIPSGVWQGVYILDGLLSNQCEMMLNEVSGNTHAENVVVFGLAHLLRIRQLKAAKQDEQCSLFDGTTEQE